MLQNQNSTHTKQSLYNLIGGENGTSNLVKVFYDIVETSPEGQTLLLLHLRGNGVAHSRIEQFNFLSGFFSGPRLYMEKHGHANLRTMHEHVEINKEAKDAWLKCMSMAIDAIGYEENLKNTLILSFTSIAERLVNRED